MDSGQDAEKSGGKYPAILAFTILVFALIAFCGVYYTIYYSTFGESSKVVHPARPTPDPSPNLNNSARSIVLHDKVEAENRFSALPNMLALNADFQEGVRLLIDGDVFTEQGKHAAADKKYKLASSAFRKTEFGVKTETEFFNGARPQDDSDFEPVYNQVRIRITPVDTKVASIRAKVEKEYAESHGLQVGFDSETSMSPSMVFVGGSIDVCMQYVILGAGAGVKVKEIQAITHQGKEIVELSNHEKNRKDSTWRFTNTFNLPEDIVAGDYELKQMIVVDSNEYTRSFSFTVLPAPQPVPAPGQSSVIPLNPEQPVEKVPDINTPAVQSKLK